VADRRRGRPRTADPRDECLQIRLTRAERVRLDTVAAINRQSRLAFILTALNCAAGDCSNIVIFERREEDEAA
jgi:uncharacterized protein (DUF1778 family)